MANNDSTRIKSNVGLCHVCKVNIALTKNLKGELIDPICVSCFDGADEPSEDCSDSEIDEDMHLDKIASETNRPLTRSHNR